MHSLICCRILLNIRDAGRRDMMPSVHHHEIQRAMPGLVRGRGRPPSGLVFVIGPEGSAAESGTDATATHMRDERLIELTNWRTATEGGRESSKWSPET